MQSVNSAVPADWATIDGILTSTTTLGQSEPGSNDNKENLYTP